MMSLIDRIILLLGQFGPAVVGGAMWITFECWPMDDGDFGDYWVCLVGDTSGNLVKDYHASGYGKE